LKTLHFFFLWLLLLLLSSWDILGTGLPHSKSPLIRS
jgi:hypothetical protein